MIPFRIKLAGFLSYKEEQEVRFGGAAVWMLAGTNGSGKSSVFDAVTYALFGHHRGGSQNAAELINKDSSALAVEFDFKLDGRLFRAKRTLRRSQKGAIAGTQQMFALPKGAADDSDAWEAVEKLRTALRHAHVVTACELLASYQAAHPEDTTAHFIFNPAGATRDRGTGSMPTGESGCAARPPGRPRPIRTEGRGASFAPRSEDH